MKKKLVLMISVLISFGLFCACSKDDEITAKYHVLDKNGRETSVFNYGDEILFELIVTNSTNQTLKMDELELLDGAFIVYNSEGQMFNPIPNWVLMMRYVSIEPGEQFCRQQIWPWAIVPLPTGKYYSTYTLNIDNINKTYTINFEIKKL